MCLCVKKHIHRWDKKQNINLTWKCEWFFRFDLVIEREREKESQLTAISINNYADCDCKIISCTLGNNLK